MGPKLVFLLLAFMVVLAGCTMHDQRTCASSSVEECPPACVVCPPCAACSSLSCQSEEFCASIGFDREWYASISRLAAS